MSKKYILTEEELRELLDCKAEISALEACGVDNWDGYDMREEYRQPDYVDNYIGKYDEMEEEVVEKPKKVVVYHDEMYAKMFVDGKLRDEDKIEYIMDEWLNMWVEYRVASPYEIKTVEVDDVDEIDEEV